MKLYANLDEENAVSGNGVIGYPLFTLENTCVEGLETGVGVYTAENYPEPAVHADNEGFFVSHGQGFAKVGDTELSLTPGTTFVAPAGVSHAIKKDRTGGELRIFQFHWPAAC